MKSPASLKRFGVFSLGLSIFPWIFVGLINDHESQNASTVCPEKRDQNVFVISYRKVGRFWWNSVHRFLNKFDVKKSNVFHFTWIMSLHYLVKTKMQQIIHAIAMTALTISCLRSAIYSVAWGRGFISGRALAMVSAVTNDSEDRLCICIAAGRFGRVLLWIVTIASDRAALGPTNKQTDRSDV